MYPYALLDIDPRPIYMIALAYLIIFPLLGWFTLKKARMHLVEYEETHQKKHIIFGIVLGLIAGICTLCFPLLGIMGFSHLKWAKHYFTRYKDTHETMDLTLCKLLGFLTAVCLIPLLLDIVLFLRA